ncbi:DUF4177 domain-containing protein [Paenibacillus humicola]|uniref:DUF4177 domain-containing protein n=1 Tax=Paenibacillus humicola TaxID=3110540 RepID=UPI00237AEAEF|nr:DUF4177 domain-containing protein [Paenibacillus humicola]
MEQWEYRTMKYRTGGFLGGKVNTDDFEVGLNLCGSEGWELVSCFDTNSAQGESRDVIAVFKRKKGSAL